MIRQHANEPIEDSEGRIAGNTFCCADAPTKTSGIPANKDRGDKFVAQPKSPPPFFLPLALTGPVFLPRAVSRKRASRGW